MKMTRLEKSFDIITYHFLQLRNGMVFRNSILSIFRSKGKSVLFTLVIFALTLLLALGISVWVSVAQFLVDCDDFYTTIGLFEYMGTGYPNDTVYDASMEKATGSLNLESFASDDATISWETPVRSFGYVDGFWRTDNFMPDQMLSVLVVGNASYDTDSDVYSTIIMKTLYSYKCEEDTIILIDGNFGTFEQNHYYLVFGEVYHRQSPLLHLRIAQYTNAIAAQSGVEVPRMIDITSNIVGGEFYKIPENNILVKIAQTLPITNNGVLVVGTNNLTAELPFHQQELYIVKGRSFTDSEYSQGDPVAVISELMAARLGIGVGDSIDLSAAVSNQPGMYNSYWVEDGFSYRAEYKVIGIMNTIIDKSWYVYVPRTTGVPWSQFPVGYTLGVAVLRNEDASDFYARMEPALDNRVHLTIYDQGYSTVATPYRTILNVAKIITAVCALVELAVVALFGFLFVYRQRETSETMLMLGAGRSRVIGYFLYSSGFIALIATSIGTLSAYLLHGTIIDFVARSAGRFQLIDSRYSNGNLTILKTLEFAPDIKLGFFLLVGFSVFLLILTACLLFTSGTFSKKKQIHREKIGPSREYRSASLAGGGLKYALLSIVRGGWRSAVVPLLAVAVIIFFGQLSTTVLRYREQLDTIYANTTIEGYYTDINGKQVGNLVLNAYDVANVYRSGYIDTLPVSKSTPYYYLGITRQADGTEFDISPLYVPVSFFGFESLEAAILRGPDLTATNNIRKSPDFFYADTVITSFLGRYDESILTIPANDPRIDSCIIPTSLMEKLGIALGDTIRVAVDKVVVIPEEHKKAFLHFDLRVVGSYEKQSAEDTIYIPFSLVFGQPLIWEEGLSTVSEPAKTLDQGYTFSEEQKYILQSPQNTLNSASFTLTNARDLSSFKDFLQKYGYSQVQQVSSVREFIVLKDAYFNNAVASVNQQIRYIKNLYPFLYALVGIIATVVSYLLVISRKKEFATMRGLGATRTRTFFSFFFEQGLLCLFGTGLGLTAWAIFWKAPTQLHLVLTAAFVFVYLAGCTVSVLTMNRENVLKILFDRD
jgi:ABC-type lipoprotein release transport system permease subunit